MKPKTIVVVGESRGIGREMVKLFASEPNAKVLALSRNSDRMRKAFSEFKNVECHVFDLTTEGVREKCEAIFSTVEKIDILINNAGYLVNKPFEELTREDLEHCYSVNVLSVIETVQAALRNMHDGHIVNVSSIGGVQGSIKFPGLTAYSTSKAALCSFTELFAEEYKDSSVRMNCLALGAAQTEMLEEAFPGYVAPVSAEKMAEFIVQFALTGHKWMNGKIIPVSLSTP